MTTKTFEVDHEGSHEPTDAQLRQAFRAAVKDEDYKVEGDPTFIVVENTSGGPSKVRATFDVKADAKPATAKPKAEGDKHGTMTVGG